MKQITSLFKLTLVACVFIFFSCSSDEPTANTEYTLSQVTTLQPQVNGLNATLGGTLTLAGDFLDKVGVCWSEQPNPTINDWVISENYSALGEFTFEAVTLEANKTYYARAFASSYNVAIPVQYGNQVTFTTGTSVTTLLVTNILSTKATLNSFVVAGGEGSIQSGFVYSTSPNPTINNGQYISGSITPPDNHSIDIQDLTPDTFYYVRAYRDGVYGEQVQFRTTGYFGPGGGYVAYDKGEVTDGWRYLEIHPTTLNFNSNGIGSQWGTLNTFVSGTLPQVGTGPENTSIIANTATEVNCAAKLCQNLTLNGQSDWFLGSREEMILVANSVYDAGHYLEPMWTSTQHDESRAIEIGYNFNQQTYVASSDYKSIGFRVYPIRRY